MSGLLPVNSQPRCMFCSVPIARPGSPLVLHEVRGFTRPRSAGGANHIIAREETGQMVCERCAIRVVSGHSTEQGALFDG